MGKRFTAHHHISSLRTASFFLLFVTIIILIAAGIKLSAAIQQSSFDGVHQFVLLLQSQQAVSYIVVFTPSAQSVVVIPVTSAHDEPIGKDLHIGIDGTVPIAFGDTNAKQIQHTLFQAILHDRSSQVSWYDLLRFYWLAKTGTVTVTDSIDLPKEQLSADSIKNDFTDPTIFSDNQTIQILNASDISGLGSRLSTLISNSGGDVIDIRTSPTDVSHSEVKYYGTISYTAKRISHLLHFPLQNGSGESIADVQIIIGTDSAVPTRF